MTRTLLKLALGTSLAILTFPSDVFAGRGGGRGGGMQRGGGGGGGGMQRGGGGGGMQRGGGGMQPGGGGGGGGGMQRGGGGMQRGGGGGGGGGNSGGGMSHSPSFSQPHPPANGSSTGSRNPYANSASTGGRNSNSNNPYAGAGAANRNPSTLPNNGAAAAGAGYANRNQSTPPNGGAAAADAGYANRNQSNYPNAGAAAVGAGYANRNNSTLPNDGAGAVGAAAGAGYANRNNSTLPNNGAGALGARIGAGYWNGNNSVAWGMAGYGMGYGGVGAWGTGSPMYDWGYSGYSNPYSGGDTGGGDTQQVNINVPQQDASATAAYNYAQPINTTAAAPEPTAAEQAASAFDQARDVFRAGDYGQAQQLAQQALTQSPNDTTLHEFLALVLFAQGQYEPAAAPLYAALSVGRGWNWTTLSGMYPDVDTYTGQLRKLEAYARANPASAPARFVLGYHYLCQGHDENAVEQFKAAAKLQPGDTLSAQLIAQFQPPGSAPLAAASSPPTGTGKDGKLPGNWAASPAKDVQVALAIRDDGDFNWVALAPGRPTTTIAGQSAYTDGVLTLSGESGQSGALVGRVVWQDDDHFIFRLVGGPSGDAGLKFGR